MAHVRWLPMNHQIIIQKVLKWSDVYTDIIASQDIDMQINTVHERNRRLSAWVAIICLRTLSLRTRGALTPQILIEMKE
jgi:hypothetical protein